VLERPDNAFTRWTNRQAPIVGTWITAVIVGVAAGVLGLLMTGSIQRFVLIAWLVTLSTGLIISFFVIKNGGRSAWRRGS
jgi:hypothetical protein